MTQTSKLQGLSLRDNNPLTFTGHARCSALSC
jgi:hypothetical protein